MSGRLFFEKRGAGPRIVLVHGFTQNRHCFGAFAEALAADHEVVCVDAPGHGGSSEVQVNLQEGASCLAETTGEAIYLGYSMGGRLCLQLAVQAPRLVKRLILVSATPGIEDPAERAARRAADEALALELEREGVPRFLERWLAQPMFAGLGETFLSERLSNTVSGLASSLRLAGQGAQEPLWNRLRALTMPVLLVTGANDEKFTAIAARMRGKIGGNAEHYFLAGKRHAPHLEAPQQVAELIRRWLRSILELRAALQQVRRSRGRRKPR